MKNIFVLPTSQASRLYLGNNRNFVFGMMQTSIQSRNDDFTNQHIYITSDEAIEEWYIYEGRLLRASVNHSKYELLYGKPITLTTDQDLIKDGVQAIDDEFLEWFVKNSSCEWVEVRYTVDFNSKAVIIIPKEEPKQETTLEEAALNIIPDRTSAGWIDCFGATERIGFIKGANYQAKRSYSEEEVLQALNIGFTSTDETWDECVEFAKEQFKKK
jgi:hypothetical protein